MKKETIHILIQRYFEGETSVAEESELLENLLKIHNPDDEEREALAVMGYTRVDVNNQVKGGRLFGIRRFLSRNVIKVAASIILVFAVGITFVTALNRGHETPCYAYIGGEKIENRNEVLHLMRSDMAEITDATSDLREEVRGSLGEMGIAISEMD